MQEKEVVVATEEQAVSETAQPAQTIEKGIILFHDVEGALHFKEIGTITLENISYYSRYLQELERVLWEQRMGQGGAVHAEV